MNFCLVTAKIAEQPKEFKQNSKVYVIVKIKFPHSHHDLAHIVAIAEGKIARNIINFYIKNDYIVVEGEILILQKMYTLKQAILYVTDVQPAVI